MAIAWRDFDGKRTCSPRCVLLEGRYDFTNNRRGFVGAVRDWDIAPDGQRFLLMKRKTLGRLDEVVIVQHWFEELKRLVPAN